MNRLTIEDLDKHEQRLGVQLGGENRGQYNFRKGKKKDNYVKDFIDVQVVLDLYTNPIDPDDSDSGYC